MSIVTLTSDLGTKDFYIGAVKGALLSLDPTLVIVDISHDIDAFGLQEASFTLRNAFPSFPAGTVHIAGIKTASARNQRHLIISTQGHYFIGPDNGLFTLMLDDMAFEAFELPAYQGTFPIKELYPSAAIKLAHGVHPSEIGPATAGMVERIPFRATSMGDLIQATVIHIDSFGNCITNLDKNLFSRTAANRPFVIGFASYEVNKLSTTYADVPDGELLALFNAAGLLEIAINGGRATSLLNLKVNSGITIHFI